MAIELTDEEFNNLFKEQPVQKNNDGTPLCPFCSYPFSSKNMEYYNGATEAGTECCNIQIDCDICKKTIWRGGAWMEIENKDELIEVLEESLDGERGDGWET